MPDYRSMYTRLFNACTDAIRLLDRGEDAAARQHPYAARRVECAYTDCWYPWDTALYAMGYIDISG